MKMSDILLDGFGLEKNQNYNPRKTLRSFTKFKYLFIISIIISVILAALYLFFAIPQFEINSKIVIKDKEKGVDFSDNPLMKDFDNYRASKIIENEIEVFQSSQLMESVLLDLDIFTSLKSSDEFYRVNEYYKNDRPLKINWEKKEWIFEPDNDDYKISVLNEKQFELKFNDKTKTYNFGEIINGHLGDFSVELMDLKLIEEIKSLKFTLNFYQPLALAAQYSDRLKVEPVNKQSSVLNISILDNIPQRGVDIIDKLIEVYNLQTEQEKNFSAASTVDFLTNQISTLGLEIDSIENNIESLKKQNQISDIATEARLYLENSNDSKNQLSVYKTQIQVVESIQRYLNNSSGEFTAVPSSLSIDDPILINSINIYNDLQRERERLLRTIQPGSPILAGINEKLTSQKLGILENLKNIKESLTIAANNINENSSRYDYKSQRIPQIERNLQDISRLQMAKMEQFQYLNQKKEEALMSLSATSNSFLRIIDTAKASYGPVKPNKIIILFFALTMGFGIPFLFVFTKNFFNNKIDEKEEAEFITGLPIIAEISKNESKQNLVFTNDLKSPVAEQFRLMRSNIYGLSEGKKGSIILITSSTAGEGKTFCSINLGISFNLVGKKVIILEFDLRKPSLLKNLGLPKQKVGIVDYLIRPELKYTDILNQHPSQPNLWYMGAGKLVANPAEIMSNNKLEVLLNELREEFDYVIMDSSPVGLVPDAFSLAKFSDATLYVLKANFTTREQLGFLNQFGVKDKLNKPVLVLNGVSMVKGYGYGYNYEPVLD